MQRLLRVCSSAAVVLCAVCSTVRPAEARDTTLAVGAQPLSIIPVAGTVHVFHNQVDRDFDMEQDDGDSPASWWILNAATGERLQSVEFAWGFVGYPFRPYIDIAGQTAYIAHQGRVRSFSLSTQELLRDTVAPHDAAGIAARGSIVFLSVRPSFSDPGHLIVYNTETGQETQRTVGVNPQQIVPFATSDGAEGVLVLSEGGFGMGSAPSVLDKHFHDGTAAPAPLELGATGNHMAVQGDRAYVAMNGSACVKVVDIRTWAVVDSIAVPTTPGNGPREVVVDGDNLFVTTFDDDVRWYSISSGALLRTYEPGGRPEGAALVDGRLWIANAYEAGSFTSASTIAVWDFAAPTSVAALPATSRPVVAPSVVTDEARITVPLAAPVPVRIEVLTALGESAGELRSGPADGGVYHARFVPSQLGLASGRYFLRIAAGGSVHTVPVTVVR